MPRRRRTSRGRTAPPAAREAAAGAAAPAADHVDPGGYEAEPLRRVALGVLCAKVALVSLAFDPLALSVFAQPKAVLSQALGYILVVLLVGLVVKWRRLVWMWSPIHVVVLSFAVAYILATVTALDKRVALFGSPDRELG